MKFLRRSHTFGQMFYSNIFVYDLIRCKIEAIPFNNHCKLCSASWSSMYSCAKPHGTPDCSSTRWRIRAHYTLIPHTKICPQTTFNQSVIVKCSPQQFLSEAKTVLNQVWRRTQACGGAEGRAGQDKAGLR